jgi:hypothetical protein
MSLTAITSDFKWEFNTRARYLNKLSQGFIKQAVNKNSNFSLWTQRNQLGLFIKDGENYRARLDVINNFVWGSDNNQNTPGGGRFDSFGSTLNPYDSNSFIVNQAWVQWKASESLFFKLGRFHLSWGDGSIAAISSFGSIPFSHDGFISIIDLDFLKIDILGIKSQERDSVVGNSEKSNNTSANHEDPEQNSYGVVVAVKNLPAWVKSADVHFLKTNYDTGVINPLSTASRLDLTRYGVSVLGEFLKFDFHLVGDIHSGNALNTKISGSQFNVGSGYTFTELLRTRVGGRFHGDSGNDSVTTESNIYLPFYPSKHSHGGAMDVLGFGNLTYYEFNLRLYPFEELLTEFRYLGFSKTKVGTELRNGPKDADGNVLTTSTTSSTIGSEIDFLLGWKVSDTWSINGFFGVFSPGAAITDVSTSLTKAHSKVYIEVLVHLN